MQQIPFYKPSIGEPEINEVVDCLRSGWLTTGPKTKQFEAEFARYLRHTHAVAVNSCTAALHLALEAVGLQARQTVVVPTMTFAATAEAVRYFNATPLLVDCRPADLNLDVADAAARIESAIGRGEDVTAIIPVHYGGQIGDMAGVLALAKRYDLKIIEDAAHCCPAYYREDARSPWKTVGPRPKSVAFPFTQTKPSLPPKEEWLARILKSLPTEYGSCRCTAFRTTGGSVTPPKAPGITKLLRPVINTTSLTLRPPLDCIKSAKRIGCTKCERSGRAFTLNSWARWTS